MPVLKRVSLCLLLIAIHAIPIGSKAAAVPATLDVLDSDDTGNDDDYLAPPANASPDGQASASDKTANRSVAGGGPAFLRKNSEKRPSGGDAAIRGKDAFRKAFGKAIGGGVPGAIAGMVQVLSLMWLRTVINYQYRYGSSFLQALTTLYGMGGIPRLYSGVAFALIQAPLSRFVSTAANDGVGVLLQNFNWGPGREVVVAAFVVGFFRVTLMPIDTCKTVMQIEGRNGLAQLMSKVRKGRVSLLYAGAVANAVSAWIGHYPWFYTYNILSRNEALLKFISWKTGRNALIGLASSIVSDTVANFMRVIKTTKQSLGSTRSETTYAETISLILAVDGLRGLFGRGLKTRILGNALQSILFTVVWRGLSERWQGGKNDEHKNDGDGNSSIGGNEEDRVQNKSLK